VKKIQIPAKHKSSLEKRFDYRNRHYTLTFVKDVIIKEGCSLCLEYQTLIGCPSCPFDYLRQGDTLPNIKYGCSVFVKEILGSHPHFKLFQAGVWWLAEFDDIVKLELEWLKRMAEKRLEFI